MHSVYRYVFKQSVQFLLPISNVMTYMYISDYIWRVHENVTDPLYIVSETEAEPNSIKLTVMAFFNSPYIILKNLIMYVEK